jgi:pSer/pThr/pTyr-binding forkhead associated (FHA) protein
MTAPTIPNPTVEGVTERFDPVECLDDSVRRRAEESLPQQPGRYVEVQGTDRTLMIPLGDETVRVGRGLGADLRLDESSVSRRHAILVSSAEGTRILDDRSSNGTIVNGRRVQQADLASGDVVVIGRVVLRYLEV